MRAVSTQQIYDLVLDISRDVAELEASIDELLVEMRGQNERASLCRQHLLEASRYFYESADMKSAILVFPGINRERDMARALKLASGHEPAMVWHAETALPKGTDLVVVPGGFSYGDYLRCGAIAARAPVMDAVRDFAAMAAGSCSASATASRSSASPGCCPAS